MGVSDDKSTSHTRKTCTWLLLITAQNNDIRTNRIKTRIDKTQQNSKCRRCSDRDETIISECCKLAQKEYKTRHDLVGKVIHWDMCKRFKFDHTNKWYMHNPAPVQENDTHKLLWNFDLQTDYLISSRRPDLIIINEKEKLQNCRICCSRWPQNKTEKIWIRKDEYLDLARELKKTVEYEGDNYTNCDCLLKGLLKGLDNLEVCGRVKTIQRITFLRTAWKLRKVQETWEDLLSLKLQWKTISWGSCEKLQWK